MKLILGDCLEKLKELPENSVDSVVCDPPYELGFMGKSWDNTGIANNPLMWAECLRVLKPGGHLLAFSGTRTYHRMAVAIEDAGFEVRDMIEWVYGSGFPKSLNIGKAVDKLQGNEREVVGKAKYADRRKDSIGVAVGDNTYGTYGPPPQKETKGTSEYEGWGTALKPAHEPICMARKPLADGGLDVAKTICYNIRENSLINNSNILWRIKNVKNVGKQKTKQTSSLTEQQKTVEVSVRTVSESENQNLGKRIEKLSEKMREDTERITGKSLMNEAECLTEQTKNESLPTQEHINENEKKKLSLLMEESVSVAENQDLSSLPLTISEVVEENIEKKSKVETSTPFLRKQDTQKTDSDCSVATATSQWVCMDIVRTIKVSFENKEYDFEQLSDGSLIWNDKLKPYREPKPLNVAENCLKWGTGGINIDESRVEGEKEGDPARFMSTNGMASKNTYAQDKWTQEQSRPVMVDQTKGRFPANLIHDNSEEVRECFPEAKGGAYPAVRGKSDIGAFGGGGTHKDKPNQARIMGDSGNASRFFKSIIYQAKSSKADRNSNGSVKNIHPTCKPTKLMEYLIKMVTPKGGVVLDPFMGSGSTGVAAKENGFSFIGIEMEEDYIKIAEARIKSIPDKLL